MRTEPFPSVSLSALREVRGLLALEADRIETIVVQAQHQSRDPGGADADDVPIQGPTGRAVPSAAASTEALAGCLPADAALVGTDDERTSQQGTSHSCAAGGER